MKTTTSTFGMPDLAAFRGKNVVARLQKNQRQFAGFCHHLIISGRSVSAHIEPFVGLDFSPSHDIDPSCALFAETDRVIPGSLRERERPFKLGDLIEVTIDEQIIIVSCSEGIVVLSTRLGDLEVLETRFEINPFGPFALS